MDPIHLFGTALALAMDAFAVAAAVSVRLDRITPGHVFRLSWHFGFFQAAMPVAGWLGGSVLSTLMSSAARWIASGLLMAIGLRMIWESRARAGGGAGYDPTRGWSLVGLSAATSIDALAVGVSFGLIGLSIWMPALVIGCVAFAMTCAGIWVGRGAGGLLGPWAERAGGMVLVGLAARILLRAWGGGG